MKSSPLPNVLSLGGCLDHIGGMALLCICSCNGDQFVRWPDSTGLPLGRRCHPHGPRRTDASERREEPKRARRREKDEGAWPLLHGRDAKHLFACTCKDAPGRTGVHTLAYANRHAVTHLQEQSNSCIIHAECKLILKHAKNIFLLLLSIQPNSFFKDCFPLLLWCFYLHFVCVFCWDVKHFGIHLVS